MIDNVIHQQPAANPVLAWLLESLGGAQYLQRNLWMGAAAILAINALICVCVFLRGYWNAVISDGIGGTADFVFDLSSVSMAGGDFNAAVSDLRLCFLHPRAESVFGIR